MAHGKTGTAPGTTVLTIPNGRSLGYIPNDFDFSRQHLDYQRWHKGWVSGYLSGGLGQETPVSHEAALRQLEVYKAQLEAEKAVAELQHTKSSRTWMIVGGVVGVLTLAVSIYAVARG